MRIAYVSNIGFENASGVGKKILAQAEAWRSKGHEVGIFSCAKAAFDGPEIRQFAIDTSYLRWRRLDAPGLLSSIAGFQPDLVYLRAEPFKGYFRKLAAWPLVVEVNSKDVAEYLATARDALKLHGIHGLRGLLGRLKLAAKKLYAALYCASMRQTMESIVSAWIYPTEELSELLGGRSHRPRMVIPNSIPLPLVQSPPRPAPDGSRLVFLGSPGASLWHGLDILLALTDKLPPDMSIDIVGMEGMDRPRVRYHGFLKREEYRGILEQASVGIGTLGLFRKGMAEACPLKTREYLAFGLPVIIGYKDAAFGDKPPEWAFQVPNNATWVEDEEWVERVVDFVRRMSGRRVSRNECAPYVDEDALEGKRLDFLATVVKGRALEAGRE